MSKSELLAKTSKIQESAKALLERAASLRTEAGNMLQAAKRSESALITKSMVRFKRKRTE